MPSSQRVYMPLVKVNIEQTEVTSRRPPLIQRKGLVTASGSNIIARFAPKVLISLLNHQKGTQIASYFFFKL